MKRKLFLILYYGLFRYFPTSDFPIIGHISRKLRYMCGKRIFKFCGKNVNIERMAFFGKGYDIVIGDNSGIGINCTIPPNTIIGNNVMMGPNCYFFAHNHRFDRIDIPMIEQGKTDKKQTIIEDDVWIGRDVTFTPGRIVKRGTIIGASCLLCRNFPEYSVVGGNPSVLIKSRKY